MAHRQPVKLAYIMHLTARLVLVWKKDALFSPAAEKFFELVRGDLAA